MDVIIGLNSTCENKHTLSTTKHFFLYKFESNLKNSMDMPIRCLVKIMEN